MGLNLELLVSKLILTVMVYGIMRKILMEMGSGMVLNLEKQIFLIQILMEIRIPMVLKQTLRNTSVKKILELILYYKIQTVMD